MKVLVINAGSSSLKYQLFDMNNEKVIAKGNCEKIGIEGSFIVYKANGIEKVVNEFLPSHQEAIDNVLNLLTDKEIGVISSLDEVESFGHRVVHGGEIYSESVIVDDQVIKNLESVKDFAPLHNPPSIAGMKACLSACPNKPHIVVVDTAFHQSMPQKAFLYGLPYEAYTDWKIRRYGAHGTSHRYVANEMAKVMGKPIEQLKLITVHLGNGSSICAVKNGKSVDTSMGFTPMAGLIMGTRCGDIDPSILEYINSKTGWSIKEITTYLNKKSGVLGINGKSPDMRDNNKLIEQGSERAKLVIQILAYGIKKYIGAYSAAMGGLDGIVFTGGIGENQEDVREICLEGLEFLGIKFNKEYNYKMPRGTVEELSLPDSKIKIFRIPTNEELEIARDCVRLCK